MRPYGCFIYFGVLNTPNHCYKMGRRRINPPARRNDVEEAGMKPAKRVKKVGTEMAVDKQNSKSASE